jgi:hypothetical protein
MKKTILVWIIGILFLNTLVFGGININGYSTTTQANLLYSLINEPIAISVNNSWKSNWTNWNSSGFIINWSNIISGGDNTSWNESYANSLYSIISEPIAISVNNSWKSNVTGYLGLTDQRFNETTLAVSVNNSWKSNWTNWNSSGFIINWNLTGMIRNWTKLNNESIVGIKLLNLTIIQPSGLPTCNAGYNGTIARNLSGIYVCGNTGATWTKI